MDWINFNHLQYFWVIAKSSSLTQAAETLHLAQPTLSNQLKKLEKAVGSDLFERRGRSLVLTETGQTVFRYADEIFSLGQELSEVIRGGSGKSQRLKLVVGVPDVLPKLVVYRLLEPALRLTPEVQLVCYEGKYQELLAELALHRIDLVLADSPVPPQTHVRAFNHALGECGISVMGTPALIDMYTANFPASLHDAPMLLPTQNTSLRRDLEKWFDQKQIRPQVRHEFEDSAVLKVFGQQGAGLFVVPTATETEVCRQYSVQVVGRIEEVRERFYAISAERRLKHPAVIAICDSARGRLFHEE